MYIINIKDVRELRTPGGNSVRYLLSKEIGTPNFEMRYFELKKGAKTAQEVHPWEHEVFVIKGKGIVRGGENERKVRPGDAIFIPPNEVHQFWNFKEELFGFICCIPNGCEDDLKS